MSISKVDIHNFKDRAVEIECEYARAARGHKGPHALYALANGSGNLQWEFGDFRGARRWFREAVSQLRAIDPSWRCDAVAYASWKAGDLEDMEAECRGVVADRSARVRDVERSGAPQPDQGRRMGLHALDLAMSGFLLSEYQVAREWSERSIRIVGERPGTARALSGLADAAERRNEEAYRAALRVLRQIVRPWPTFESSANIDLYRYALSLSRERFGGIPDELAEELLSPEGGESVDFLAILHGK